MSATSQRAARREREAAAGLGTRRVLRRIGESAPDCEPVALAGGAKLGPEVKSRKVLPKLVTGALEQARRYFGARAIPIAVLYELGREGGIVALELAAFALLVGLDVARLPTRVRRRARREKQLELFGSDDA